MFDILSAIAADPNVAPAFRAAVRPAGFGEYDNWVIDNRLGKPCTVVFARSAAEALAYLGNPEGYTARVQDYAGPISAEEAAVGERASAAWGRRLD